MKIAEFTVPGEPVAKGRARSFIRNGHVAHYTPDKTARYENLVKMAASEAMAGRLPSEAPLNMEIVAFMGIAASWSKKRQQAARDGLERPTKKPDLDNIVKAVKDGLNGVAWKDDSQVVRLTAGKFWSDKPRVEVRIWEWAE
jgi:Holliday junction resolvase RusA-like endonuclease